MNILVDKDLKELIEVFTNYEKFKVNKNNGLYDPATLYFPLTGNSCRPFIDISLKPSKNNRCEKFGAALGSRCSIS